MLVVGLGPIPCESGGVFVFLSKLLPPFLYPIGLTALLLAAALALRRRRRLQTALIALGLAVLLLGSNRWVALGLMRSLEWRYLPAGELPAADAILVLGGATWPEEYPRPTAELNDAGDRVVYAAYLYHQGKAPLVILSGGNIGWMESHTSTPAEQMADLLGLMGVPREAMRLQGQSRNTHEDVLYSSRILSEEGARRVLLVTSAWHMPRSVALFHRLDFEVVPAPTDFTVTETMWRELTTTGPAGQLIFLLPDARYMNLTARALKEYLGMVAYGLRGWAG